MRTSRIKLIIEVSLTILFLFYGVLPVVAAGNIAVVVSKRIRPYILAMEGLRSVAGASMSLTYLDEYSGEVLPARRFDDCSTIVAIGPDAARQIFPFYGHEKTFVLMVLDPEDLFGSCVRGVDLRVPISVQMKLIAEKMGKGQRIGIPYKRAENEKWVRKAVRSGSEYGLLVRPIPVEGRETLMADLAREYEHIDVLLFIPDSTFSEASIIEHIIKESITHGVASIGYNRFFFKTGATLSFDIDYYETGRLAGRTILSGMGGPCSLFVPVFSADWNDKAWRALKGIRERMR